MRCVAVFGEGGVFGLSDVGSDANAMVLFGDLEGGGGGRFAFLGSFVVTGDGASLRFVEVDVVVDDVAVLEVGLGGFCLGVNGDRFS